MRWIHDVTTDAGDPPVFVELRDTRLGCANGLGYSGLPADEHSIRYPDLQPAKLACTPKTVFDAALAVVNALHWKIAAAIENEGRIEATATTPLLRFKDDVVIRIRADNSGARLDIRSASRIGSSDFGANAKRLRTFLGELNIRLKKNT